MDNLNSDQLNAIEYEKNVLLIACPGSGKTHTLIHKVAREISKIDTHRRFVIAITYTNNAADEMEKRLDNLGIDTNQLWVGTIHKFCLEWIIYPYSIYNDCIPPNFAIANDAYRYRILREIHPGFSEKNIKKLADGIEFHRLNKYERILRDSIPPNCNTDIWSNIKEYLANLRLNRLLDFQDILEFSYNLLCENKFISRNIQNMVSFFAVDEYQDMNAIQYLIVSEIFKGSKNTNMFIVGDPNQAIFSSLGGVALDIDDLNRLTGKSFKRFELSRNYRSSESVVEYSKKYMVQHMSMSAIGRNKNYKSNIYYYNFQNDGIDSENIGSRILDIIEKNLNLGVSEEEICILVPQNFLAKSLAREFLRKEQNINFDCFGLTPFVKEYSVWSFLSRIALTEPSPGRYVQRLLWARNILDILIEGNFLLEGEILPSDILYISNEISESLVGRYGDDGFIFNFLNDFFNLFLSRMNVFLNSEDPIMVQKNMLLEELEVSLNKFKNSVGESESMPQEQQAVKDNSIGYYKSMLANLNKGVKLTTIYKSKGEEYDTVILFGALDGYMPHRDVPVSQREDNVKKLLYVASSRARKNLWIIAENREKAGGKYYDPCPYIENP